MSSPEVPAPLHVDVVRQNPAVFLSYVVVGLACQNTYLCMRGRSDWISLIACAGVMVFNLLAVAKMQKRMGTQPIRIEAGSRSALIGREHGFSRFETPKWREDGDAILVYGTAASWRLTPIYSEKEALRKLVQHVIGEPTLHKVSLPALRAITLAIVFGAMITASAATAAPGNVLPLVLWVLGVFALAGGAVWSLRR